MPPVMGYATQLGIDTANPVTLRFDFQSEGLMLDEEMPDTNGLRGTRSRAVERIRQGIRRVHGPLTLEPTAVELSHLLQWILGGTPTGSPTVTYPLADGLQSRYVTIDRVSKVFTYSGVYVNRATIRGTQGQPLQVLLDLLGQDEAVANSGTFPALTLDVANTPFMFYDLSLSVAGSTYQPRDWEITIDNALDADRFFNSQTATAIAPRDRHITTRFPLPYGDANALYGTGGPGGVAYVATFTNGGAVLTFTAGKAIFPRKSPTVPGREEILIPVEAVLYKSGSTVELTTTLNPGP